MDTRLAWPITGAGRGDGTRVTVVGLGQSGGTRGTVVGSWKRCHPHVARRAEPVFILQQTGMCWAAPGRCFNPAGFPSPSLPSSCTPSQLQPAVPATEGGEEAKVGHQSAEEIHQPGAVPAPLCRDGVRGGEEAECGLGAAGELWARPAAPGWQVW